MIRHTPEPTAQEIAAATSKPPFRHEHGPDGARKALDDIQAALLGIGDRAVAFARAYQQAVDRWPVPVALQRVTTGYGMTHVLACGPPDAPAALLLPGAGATAVAWRDVAGGLARSHRVIAVDPPGQPAACGPSSRPPRTAAELADWLDQVLDGLALNRAALIGHCYGAWLALRYALHAPQRVSRLVLLDPTDCFAPLSLLNLGEPGGIDITPWTDRVQLIDAKYAGTWELPVVGKVTAPAAVLIRPDGYVAWVGDLTHQGLPDALTIWFGPPTATQREGTFAADSNDAARQNEERSRGSHSDAPLARSRA